MPVILLDFHKWTGGGERPRDLECFDHPLTSEEATTLARQLVSLADRIDLDLG